MNKQYEYSVINLGNIYQIKTFLNAKMPENKIFKKFDM